MRGRADQVEVGEGDGSQLIAKHGADGSQNKVITSICSQKAVQLV